MITHFGAITLRVTGAGNLDLTLYSLDDVESASLTPLVLSAATNRMPTVLANFNQQRAQLKISTNEINEKFIIGEIIIYTKPVATSYPQ